MDHQHTDALRAQLLQRRDRLREFILEERKTPQLINLVHEVELALERLNDGTYGICEICHEGIEDEYLHSEPLVRVCLAHLSEAQQRAVERDLQLASQIQGQLLPQHHLTIEGWETSYHYEPVGPVSGDYCDIVKSADGATYFLFGDVSGKGVAASLLVSHLHAMFRTLLSSEQPLNVLMERANRLFCESTLSANFATLVCGRLSRTGEVELCNAGHCYPLVVSGGYIRSIESTGLPLGTFFNAEYKAVKLQLSGGDVLFLYTDGLTEAVNERGEEYSEAQLSALVSREGRQEPQKLIKACIDDLTLFRGVTPKADDLTIMVFRKTN